MTPDGAIRAYVGLGSNLGDSRAVLAAAVRELEAVPGVWLTAVSPLYVTEPELVREQPDFYNAVAELACAPEVEPLGLLRALQGIENRLGRTRVGTRYGPRVIDLDLLLFNETVMQEPDLILPHPRMAERAFVLVPLRDVAPNAILPDGTTVERALAALGEAVNPRRIRRVRGPKWWRAGSP
jgi:2-amino-4-hydroxy-6-hydroxymethyldihydropteridine diphosphokinase